MNGLAWFLAGMGAQTLVLTLWVGLAEIWIPVRNARRESEQSDA